MRPEDLLKMLTGAEKPGNVSDDDPAKVPMSHYGNLYSMSLVAGMELAQDEDELTDPMTPKLVLFRTQERETSQMVTLLCISLPPVDCQNPLHNHGPENKGRKLIPIARMFGDGESIREKYEAPVTGTTLVSLRTELVMQDKGATVTAEEVGNVFAGFRNVSKYQH